MPPIYGAMPAILDEVIAPAPAKGVDFTTAHRSCRMDMRRRFPERFGPGSITSDQGGNFECLASLPLAPALVSGPGSGELTVNATYVTRRVTGGYRRERGLLRRSATVTGIRSGQDVPCIVRVTAGWTRATLMLDVSTLSFLEFMVSRAQDQPRVPRGVRDRALRAQAGRSGSPEPTCVG